MEGLRDFYYSLDKKEQKALRAKLDIYDSAFYRILRGEHTPLMSTIAKLKRADSRITNEMLGLD